MIPPYPEAASTLKLLFIIPMNVFNTFTHFNSLVFYYIVWINRVHLFPVSVGHVGSHTLLSCCCCEEQRHVPFIVHMCPRFSKTALVPGIWSPALCLVAQLSVFVTAPPMNSNPPSFSSLSMEFSWQEYWSELPCPLPGNHPDPGVESRSSTCRSKNPGGFFIMWVNREATITGEAFKTMPSLIPHHGDLITLVTTAFLLCYSVPLRRRCTTLPQLIFSD